MLTRKGETREKEGLIFVMLGMLKHLVGAGQASVTFSEHKAFSPACLALAVSKRGRDDAEKGLPAVKMFCRVVPPLQVSLRLSIAKVSAYCFRVGIFRFPPKQCFLCLFWLVALLMSACVQAPPVVKVGLVGPFEGRQREVGYDVIYSARLAVREINSQGGIVGHRVALVALDDGGDPELARETAVSLTLDPAVIAVVGHWQPETTAVAAPIYAEAGLAFIPMGERPFGPIPPETLSPEFHQAYEAVTPFDEVAGPYAGTTYDAFQLLWETLTAVGTEPTGQPLTRANVFTALPEISR